MSPREQLKTPRHLRAEPQVVATPSRRALKRDAWGSAKPSSPAAGQRRDGAESSGFAFQHLPVHQQPGGGDAEIEAARIARESGHARGTIPANLQRPPTAARPLTATVEREVAGGGQALEPGIRARMEQSFGIGGNDTPPRTFESVRIHFGARSAASARAVEAQAYTVGQHIVFGAGRYAPNTHAGKQLLAHELVHVLQQSESGTTTLQRKMDEATLAQAKAPAIMADETYMDNDITKLEYFFGQEAAFHYKDGSKLTLGLIPDYVKAPVEAVDFHTARTEHISVGPDEPGTYRYIPRGIHVSPPPGTTFEDVTKSLTETVRFSLDPTSQRIVPTHVNTRTAPRACQMLRACEAEYIRVTNESAAEAVKVLKAMEVVLLIYSFIPSGGATAAGARGAAGRGAGATAVAAAARVETTLVQEFLAILRAGGSKALTVEGVLFDGVRVFREGTVLVIRRFGIKRLATAEAGQGRVMQAAYERAAIEAAKQAGAKTVRIAMEKPINPAWKAYLESQGYTWQIFDKVGEAGFEGLMTKIIKL